MDISHTHTHLSIGLFGMKRKRYLSHCETTPKQVICISLLDDDEPVATDTLTPLPESVHMHLIHCLLLLEPSKMTPQTRLITQFHQLKVWRDVCQALRAHVHNYVDAILQSDFYRPRRQIGSLSIRESNRLLDIVPRLESIDATWSLYSTLIFYMELERHPSESGSVVPIDELCRYFVTVGGGGGCSLQPLATAVPDLVIVRGLPVDNTALKTQIKRYIASYDCDDDDGNVAARLTKGTDIQRRSQFYTVLCELHGEAARTTASRDTVARADAFPIAFRSLRPEEMTADPCDYGPRLCSLALRVTDQTTGLDRHEFLLTSQHPTVTELRRSVVRTIGPVSRTHAQYAYNLRCHESMQNMIRETLIRQYEPV